MHLASFSPLVTGQMTNFEAQALSLDDPRPHPHEDALAQLGLGGGSTGGTGGATGATGAPS